MTNLKKLIKITPIGYSADRCFNKQCAKTVITVFTGAENVQILTFLNKI